MAVNPVAWLGDTALVVDVDDVSSAHRLATTVARRRRQGRAPVGIVDTVVGFRSVVVHLDPRAERPDLVERWLTRLADDGSTGPDSEHRRADGRPSGGLHLDVPAAFDGPDLEEVATLVGCPPGAVVEALTGAELQVALVGFAPGFPYLVGLPPELASIPRRPSPRAAVPAGSVAVGGGFASVYPRSTPGGWMLLGRTSVPLFDPDRPPYARLSPGDTVRFSEAPVGAVAHPSGPSRRRPLTAGRDRFVEVLDPGLLSLVEDGGRSGTAGIGVPPAGPADAESMRLANRLVGNPDRAATIEVTAVGPRLRFTGDAHVGVVASAAGGVEIRIDDRPVAAGAVSPVVDGQVLTIGRVLSGLRAYLAVAGGFETPLVVGSRSTDMLTGLGPCPLATGDRLAVGVPSPPHGQVLVPVGATDADRPAELRVTAGPHRHPTAGAAQLGAAAWTVGDQSNRIGVRLTRSPSPFPPFDAGIPSVGMVTGAVQLPTDGNPIILGPDHATVGGYPVIACVIAADLHIVGQLRPGDTVAFTTVDRMTAQRARLRRERMLDTSVTGWFPTAAGT
jgi:KipI family sensor histidine kinase inhibitor